MARTKNEDSVLTKMTVAALGAIPETVKARTDGQSQPLVIIGGKATHIKTGEDNGRVWEALMGRFQGINLATGEVFTSSKLFLPEGIDELVLPGVRDIERAVREGRLAAGEANVEFGFEIHAIKSSNPRGYSYKAVDLVAPTMQQAPDNITILLNTRAAATSQKLVGSSETAPAAQIPAASEVPAESTQKPVAGKTKTK